MAKGFKSGGKDFEKGVSGNPKGTPGLPAEVRKVRKLTHEEISQMGTMLLEQDINQIIKISEDLTQPVLRVWIARMIRKGIATKDTAYFNAVLDRIAGRIPTKMELTGSGGGPLSLVNVTEEELQRRAKEIADRFKSEFEDDDA